MFVVNRVLLCLCTIAVFLILSALPVSALPCPLSTVDKSITICTPNDGATVTSPVNIVAGATDKTSKVTAMKIYVDNMSAYQANAAELNATISMTQGSHSVTVQAWDAAGAIFKKTITITVGTSSPPPCALSTVERSVTVCKPANGAIVTSPVNIVAGTTDTASRVTAMKIYVDNVTAYSVNASSLNANVAMANGSHSITVQAWDASGAVFKKTITVNVGTSTPAPCTLSTIDKTVTICKPTNGASVTSPVNVVAGTTDKASTVTAMRIYVDNQSVFLTNAASLNTNLTLSTGSHSLVVQAWDAAGAVFNKGITINVTPPNTTLPFPEPTAQDYAKLKHIVIFVQENRSMDNYFGMLGQYRRNLGLSGTFDDLPLSKSLLDMSGHPVEPYHFGTVCHENLSPSWDESHYDVNGGKMDRFMLTTGSVPSTIDPDGTRAMGYYDWHDLPYYYELASQFATSDRFFSSILANTIPNRMYLFAGTSFGHVRPDPAPSGGWPVTTIFDKLTAAGIPWRYYYQDNSVYLAEWQTWQRDAGKVFPISQYYTDVQNDATFPSVVFIERAGKIGLDEHPLNNIQKGAANTKKILDALMMSPSWGSSAFIFTFDEGGGLYDHVPPITVPKPDNIAPMLNSSDLPGDFNQSGFRIPLIVISPWARRQYVSHTPLELTAILKLVEKRFGVTPLTQRDSNSPGMGEFFDFSNPAWLTPPQLPEQPVDGLCDFNAQNAPAH